MLSKLFIRAKINGYRTFISAVFLGIITSDVQAHPAIDMLYRFFEAAPKESDFKKYMQSPLRQKLSSEHNITLGEHNANDGSNWSGCQVGKGVMAGTYRDLSACAVSACYGRDVTLDEMKNLSYAEAEKVIRWMWNRIQASKIPNQSVANLTMHIQMQYGNIRIVQLALNELGAKLRLSGRMDKKTLETLIQFTQRDAAETYNEIRKQLIKAYGRLKGTHLYVRVINREFPPKFSLRSYYTESINLCKNAVWQATKYLYPNTDAVFKKILAVV